jgi:hypothetical protein
MVSTIHDPTTANHVPSAPLFPGAGLWACRGRFAGTARHGPCGPQDDRVTGQRLRCAVAERCRTARSRGDTERDREAVTPGCDGSMALQTAAEPKRQGRKTKECSMQTETYGTGYERQREGRVAKSIEKETSRLPSDLFMWGALGAMGISAISQIVGNRRSMSMLHRPARAPMATFFGMWVPTLLLFGVYNKIVKVAVSDRRDRDFPG